MSKSETNSSMLNIVQLCSIRKKVGAEDGDSAGTLAYNKGWKIIDDSFAFSNTIRLMVFLVTGKFIIFYQHVFCFFKIWFRIGQYDPFHTIIDNFYHVFKEFRCLWVLSPRIWNVLWMCFSRRNFLHQLKKWRDDPEIPKKLFFCFIFGLKIR